MSTNVANRVEETTISTGPVTYTLAGAAANRKTFALGFPAARTNIPAVIDAGASWAHVIGHMTDDVTFVVDSTESSSAADAPVTFAAAVKRIYVDVPASAINGLAINPVAFTLVIPLTAANTVMPDTAVTAGMTFTVGANPTSGAGCLVGLNGNVVDTPNLAAFTKTLSSDLFDINGYNLLNFFQVGTHSFVAVQNTAIVVPRAPAFAVGAAINGTPAVGVPIGFTSTVTGTPTPTVTQQWTLDGVAIVGQTGPQYTPITSDATHGLGVVATAHSTTAPDALSTSARVTVAAAPTAAPTTAPTVAPTAAPTSAPGVAAPITFDVRGSNIVESAGSNGGAYKKYAGSLSQSAFGVNDTCSVTTQHLAGDGEFGGTIVAIGTNKFVLIGFSPAASPGAYANWPQALAMAKSDGAAPAYTQFSSGTAGATGGGASVALSTFKCKRVGTTVTVESNNGIVATYTGITGPLYMNLSLYADAAIDNLYAIGAA